MAAKVKGLTLEIDGNTVGLEKGLAKLNKPINAIKNELKDVTRLLKLDPGNTELLAQKQQLLSKQIAESKDKLVALQQAKQQADADMKSGTEVNQEEYRNAIAAGVKAAWNGIKSFLSSTMTAIGTGISTAWNGFLTTVSGLCQTISTNVQTIWNGILDFFRALPSTLATLGRTMFQRMADAIKGMAGTVYSAATGCINKAVDFIKELPEKALGWGKDFINGFAKGIANAASAVVDNVRGLADDIRSLLHFSRPDEGPLRDYEKWPVDFIHGYADAMGLRGG